MANEHLYGVESTAAIDGHPLHPAVVVFPIAFLVGALVTDIVYALSVEAFWAQASFWLIVAGVVMAGVAALLGLTDFATIRQARNRTGWTHMILNIAATLISIFNLVLRLGDREMAVMPLGLALSAVVAGILTVSGWLGGELSYRHRIGIMDPARQDAAEADAEHRRAYSGD